MRPKVIISDVPCNGCTACCKSETVILYPEVDDVASYEAEVGIIAGHAVFTLKKNADGSCVYLTDNHCSIHLRAPAVCRAFDCRTWYLRWKNMSRQQRKTMLRNGFKLDKDVLEAGRQRLSTLVD